MARKKKSEIKILKQDIIKLLSTHTDRPHTLSELYNHFNTYDDDEKMFFKLILEELEDHGKILKVGRGKFTVNNTESEDLVEGVVDHVNSGFAFIRYQDGEHDIFVDAGKLNGALDGDAVKVKIIPGKLKKGKNPEGRVVDILKRGKTELVGSVKVFQNYALFKADNRSIHEDFFVAKGNLLDAEPDDLVIATIITYPSPHQQGTAKITDVLGKKGENDAEMHAIMAEFGLPIQFPEDVETLAASIPVEIPKSEIKKRRDIRDTLTFTIDPHDAKDFDDAISFKELSNDTYEVGVHIADVTHYVREGTVLEKEAAHRATSVYLVDRTIPMLPEKLSNNLCSLRPNEDKLVFSAIFEMNKEGKILKEWFGRSVMHSDRRFTYEEAQEVIEGNAEEAPYSDVLTILNTMAKSLRNKRFHNGAFNFETNEVKFQLDENGKPLGVYQKVRKDAHKLVEEFMLIANKQVARYIFHARFDKTLAKKVENNPDLTPTMVYRVHESPNPEKLENFAKFAAKLGFPLNTATQETLANSLNKLVKEIQGNPIQNTLESLAVRTMSKAKYSISPQGHFGLAFDHYSHFTSPIRRYPDMMAHRMLQHYLDGGKSLPETEFVDLCDHSSSREKQASEAERASIKYKQVEYMSYQDHDQVYNGVVTGVTDFGLFVEVENTGCEGMVRLGDLKDDYYEYDPENFRVIGQRRGTIIGFGEKVKVTIKETDLERRSMDLNLVEVKGTTLKSSGSNRGRSSNKHSQRRKSSGRKVIPPKKGRRSKKRR